MIDKDFFKSLKILDGGMGQELLSRGLQSKGSLWSASALLDERYHQMVIETHLDFIKAGANVIITNNFSARRVRMLENNVNDKFKYANKKAGELALKAKNLSKENVIIGGSLPAQNNTYEIDVRDDNIIYQNFHDQVECLRDYVDFYYLDVISSLKECKIALSVISKTRLPALLGIHIKSNGRLPSGEEIDEVINECKKYNIIGVVLSCVSPELIEKVVYKITKLDIPFGYKANLWKLKDPLPHTAWIKKPDQIGTNPTEVLGTRDDYSDEMFLNFSKKMIDKGVTIIGGCCEIKPKHIKKVSELKK